MQVIGSSNRYLLFLIVIFTVVIPIVVSIIVSHALIISIVQYICIYSIVINNYTYKYTLFPQYLNMSPQYNNNKSTAYPYIVWMGNCNKKDEALTVTNFDDQHWTMQRSSIHPLCFIMKNNYHSNVMLMKWIANTKKTNKLTKFRDQRKQEFLVNSYQCGETRKPIQADKEKFGDVNYDKRPYIVTQELIRLRDASLTEQQTAAVAYKALLAYQELMAYTGGFVAKQSMIYLSREGVPKIWVNQNLASSELEYPHPAITQQQFIASLLHQIFTLDNQKHANCKIYNYIKSGQISFSEVIAKLNYFLQQNGASLQITISKDKFDAIINSYTAKSRSSHTHTKSRISKAAGNDSKKHTMSQSTLASSNRLKFLVAANERDSTSYVRDYSQKRPVQKHQTGYSQERGGRLKTQMASSLLYYPQTSLNNSYQLSRLPINASTSFNRAHSGVLITDPYLL